MLGFVFLVACVWCSLFGVWFWAGVFVVACFSAFGFGFPVFGVWLFALCCVAFFVFCVGFVVLGFWVLCLWLFGVGCLVCVLAILVWSFVLCFWVLGFRLCVFSVRFSGFMRLRFLL